MIPTFSGDQPRRNNMRDSHRLSFEADQRISKCAADDGRSECGTTYVLAPRTNRCCRRSSTSILSWRPLKGSRSMKSMELSCGHQHEWQEGPQNIILRAQNALGSDEQSSPSGSDCVGLGGYELAATVVLGDRCLVVVARSMAGFCVEEVEAISFITCVSSPISRAGRHRPAVVDDRDFIRQGDPSVTSPSSRYYSTTCTHLMDLYRGGADTS